MARRLQSDTRCMRHLCILLGVFVASCSGLTESASNNGSVTRRVPAFELAPNTSFGQDANATGFAFDAGVRQDEPKQIIAQVDDLDASTPAAATARDAGDAAQLQAPAEQDSSALDGSTPDGSLELPACPAHPTTFIKVIANLDANAVPPVNEWNDLSVSAASCANFSTTQSIYDAAGRSHTLDMYYANVSAGKWNYHSVIDGVRVEAGSGTLEFGVTGALKRRAVIQPLRLPSEERNPNAEIELDLGSTLDSGGNGKNGIVSYPSASNVSYQYADGNVATLGFSCADIDNLNYFDGRSDVAPQPITGSPDCDVSPSSYLRISANLYSLNTIRPTWDAMSPLSTSNLKAKLNVVDQLGRNVTLDLYFQKLGEMAWQYHFVMDAAISGIEVGTGDLDFNANGSLRHVEVRRPLVIPAPGATSAPVQVDFGPTTDSGGNGVDGVTSFVTASALRQIGVGTISAQCPADQVASCNYDPIGAPRWESKLTTSLTVYGSLPDSASIVTEDWSLTDPSGTSSISLTKSITDSLGRAVDFGLHFRHVSSKTWEYHAVVSLPAGPVELGFGELVFYERGCLQHQQGSSRFRIPFDDGTPAPLITLNLGHPMDEYGDGCYGVVSSPDYDLWQAWLLDDGHPSPITPAKH